MRDRNHSLSVQKAGFEKNQARSGVIFSRRNKFYEKFDGYLPGQETTAGYSERLIMGKRRGSPPDELRRENVSGSKRDEILDD